MAHDSGTTLDPVFAATNAAFLSLQKLKTPDEREQALRFVADRLGVKAPEIPGGPGNGGKRTGSSSHGAGTLAPTSSMTPKQFMDQKRPKRHIDRIACLAYYLTHNKGTPQYKTVDLTALNTEARQPRFTSASVHVENAVKADLLTSVGKGMKAITSRGEALVEALPDQARVDKVMEEHGKPTRRRKRRAVRGAKSK
ncbi:MAG: hypothetical protein ACREMZ_11180 [Gemmatimonadales bacterium]